MHRHFTRWPSGMGLGFSYSDGEEGGLRGELAPDPSGRLIVWRGYLWRDGDTSKTELGFVEDDTHWEAGDALAALAQGVRDGNVERTDTPAVDPAPVGDGPGHADGVDDSAAAALRIERELMALL